MSTTQSASNPLKVISFPLAIRALLALSFSLVTLKHSATEIMGGFAGSSSFRLVLVAVLITFGLADLVRAFRTGIRFPDRSSEVHTLGATYSIDEIRSIVIRDESPNEKYLSWIGHWAARASDRFFALPPQYQRLLEIALTMVTFSAAAMLIILLLREFGIAGSNPEVANAVSSWLFLELIFLGYVFWISIIINIYGGSNWSLGLSINRLVNWIISLLALVSLIAFLSQYFGFTFSAAPSIDPWSAIFFAGSGLIVIEITIFAALRSIDRRYGVKSSRINESDAAVAHPQTIMHALKNFLSTSKAGIYGEIGSWEINLDQQMNMPAGSFSGTANGEYGAAIISDKSNSRLRRYGIFFANVGILISAVGYFMLWKAANESQLSHLITSVTLLVFGSLVVKISIFPLSENLWKSYLMSIKVTGSYQNIGPMVIGGNAANVNSGSIVINYTIDGGVACVYSSSFPNSSLVKTESERVLIYTDSAPSERELILRKLRSYLSRGSNTT